MAATRDNRDATGEAVECRRVTFTALRPQWLATVLLMLLPVSFAFTPAALTRVSDLRTNPVAFRPLFSLTSEQQHALEVFSLVDEDGSDSISSLELGEMLRNLDIEASDEEADALFKYLDTNSDGTIGFDEFLPWYTEAVECANETASAFQSILIGRRTVERFDQTPVADDVLRRAVECAIAAPNRSLSEPWRFIQIGPETVAKLDSLVESQQEDELLRWMAIPGWCVVTTKINPDNAEVELDDFKSTSCAVQNLMLSMWSEGVGTQWTNPPVVKTREFADICGIDTSKERVAGIVWYGFASGGLVNADPKRRKKGVDDVLSSLP